EPSLPAPVREVAILVTGAHFRAAYELYAYVIIAEQRGLSDEKLATIVAGQRPVDLTRQEAVAYDFASALVNGGVLPELTYRRAVSEFGEPGAAELSYLIGVYCLALLWQIWLKAACDQRLTAGASCWWRPHEEVEDGLSDGRHAGLWRWT
ncbi:MAG TPA: hypothetical protein VIX37_05540, partial [Candidatus Sulfotelmatobacter sp.]